MIQPTLTFVPDELPGFEQAKIALAEENDGPLRATLVRRSNTTAASTNEGTDHGNNDKAKGAVLYLHGFVDYFFQLHLAEAIEKAGFVFYALDLRRYGRSLEPSNLPNQAKEVSDYFEELDVACAYLLSQHSHIAGIVAHSTGGLIASHYLARGTYGKKVQCLVLNSPFLRFYLRPFDRFLSWIVGRVSPLAPTFQLPQTLGSAYSNTIRRDMQGEWDYNLAYKPRDGFPLYAGWFGMIRRAQAIAQRGLGLTQPILCLHSSRSYPSTLAPHPNHFKSDIVLNVDDMRAIAPKLGTSVELFEVADGLHDLYLSREPARTIALQKTVEFLRLHGATPRHFKA